MAWEISPLLHNGLWIGAFVLSAALTSALRRLRCPIWLAALSSGPAPALAIVVWFFYLEAQQPIGPYYAVVGLFHAAPALLTGLLGAAAAAFCLALRDDGASPAE